MPNRMELPEELAMLIEKREKEDRRAESNVANAPQGEERRETPDRRDEQDSGETCTIQ